MSESVTGLGNTDSVFWSLKNEAERINSLMRPSSAVLEAFEAVNQSQREMERLAKLALPRIETVTASHLIKQMEEQNRHFREIVGPLERMRESMRVGDELSRMIPKEWLSMANSIDQPFAKLSESLRSSIGTMQGSFAAAAEARMALLNGLGEGHRRRLEELAKPFQIGRTLMETSISESLKLAQGKLDLAESFRLPAIDLFTTAAVAQLWGADRFQERLRSVSKELERAFQEMEGEGKDESEAAMTARTTRFPPLDFWTLFNILLAVAFLAYQEWSSNEMEARITGEIREGNAGLHQQIANLEAMLIQVMSAKQPWELGQTQFVVRTRVARILKVPQSGSTMIAEVFPNQVVALVSERGKWVEIEYYDWIAGEKRHGWVLKKYFIRVRATQPITSDNEM